MLSILRRIGLWAVLTTSLWTPATEAAPYVGVAWARHQIKGDFDDSIILEGAGTLYDVPTVDPGNGVRFTLGWGSGAGGFELAYARTTHRSPGALRPDGYPTIDHLFDLDLVLRQPLGRGETGRRLRVYERLGLALATLRLDQSGFDLGLFDVEYEGGGFTLGAGFEVALPGGLRPFAEFDYQFVNYHNVQALGREIELAESLSCRSTGIYAGLTYGKAIPERRR